MAADKENLTQCQGCNFWYHQDCWGDHVDVFLGGPSSKYKQVNKQAESESENGDDQDMDKEPEDAEMTEEKGEDFLLCDKCMKFSDLLNSETSWMTDILLNRKNIDDLLPYICENWSTAKRLTEIPVYDFRTFGTQEFNIFEHVLLYKYWYKILEQAYRRKLHEDLYRDLLDKN